MKFSNSTSFAQLALLAVIISSSTVSVTGFQAAPMKRALITESSTSSLFSSFGPGPGPQQTAFGQHQQMNAPPPAPQQARGTKALNNRLDELQKGSPGGAMSRNRSTVGGLSDNTNRVIEKSKQITVQGGSLKTWSFASAALERVQIVLKTEGRPLDADIELWQGPDNTPHKMRVYVENGSMRPFNAVMETPRGPNTVAIRNTAQLEFPLAAFVVGDTIQQGAGAQLAANPNSKPNIVQGGAIRTYPFDPTVESVQVLLKTDGRPLNSRIELLQGPNNNKQVVEVYTEDGQDRPFFMIIEAPGSGNVIRIVNSATVEFPLTCWVEPYVVGDSAAAAEPVIGGDDQGFLQEKLSW